MHGSVLQGKKYIKFANENTVEVMAMGKIDVGVSDKDHRLDPIEGRNDKGETVEFLAGWPNLTLDQLKDLNQHCAKWNDTRGIPYTCVVNPYTLEKMSFISGGYSAGKLMDDVAVAKKALNKQYGKSVSRKVIQKLKKRERKLRKALDAGDVSKAMSGVRSMEKKVAKQAKPIQEMVSAILADVLKVAGKQLDYFESLIGDGDKAGAARKLGPLTRALKGTPLAQRAKDLLAKTKKTE